MEHNDSDGDVNGDNPFSPFAGRNQERKKKNCIVENSQNVSFIYNRTIYITVDEDQWFIAYLQQQIGTHPIDFRL